MVDEIKKYLIVIYSSKGGLVNSIIINQRHEPTIHEVMKNIELGDSEAHIEIRLIK